MTCLMDCSHTGSMMDLPFHYRAPEEEHPGSGSGGGGSAEELLAQRHHPKHRNDNDKHHHNQQQQRSVFRNPSLQLFTNIVREGLEREQEDSALLEGGNSSSSFQSFLSAVAHGLKDEQAAAEAVAPLSAAPPRPSRKKKSRRRSSNGSSNSKTNKNSNNKNNNVPSILRGLSFPPKILGPPLSQKHTHKKPVTRSCLFENGKRKRGFQQETHIVDSPISHNKRYQSINHRIQTVRFND
eukprot:CAMPEP_0116562502 /NCGR_PEP_ID=MMETSP0397-20121206/12192_1 /TAXON_ID=216820 /ORGANISM="Cyclophora tenuis, Strain ECT3854" /LENGTH=238 /DNA_ID=CAMNT_0004088799 /DNA_START=92 /DNA_END=808 /DNA_ORIENTATION=+